MGSLLEMDRLFVKGKAKFVELKKEYKIFDEDGTQVGYIREEDQSRGSKLASLTVFGAAGKKQLGMYDVGGSKVLDVLKPRAMGFRKKVRFEVSDGMGTPVGTIAQAKRVQKKTRFTLEDPRGETLGEMVSTTGLRNKEFKVHDSGGAEVGRITKKWGGAARELFTTADTYAVEIDPGATGPLRMLALAGAASVDMAQAKVSLIHN